MIHKELAQKAKGRNPLYNYDLKTLEILLSGKEVPEGFEHYLEDLGYDIRKIMVSQDCVFKDYQAAIRKYSDELFELYWKNIHYPVSVELLTQLATQCGNTWLLEQLKTGRDIKDIIHEFHTRTLNDENNVSELAINEFLEREAPLDCHFLIMSSGVNLVSTISVHEKANEGGSELYEIGYHPIARNGLTFGRAGIAVNRQPGLYNMVVNIQPVLSFPGANILNFIIEMLNHECLGHTLLGLPDHYDQDPSKCMMAVKHTPSQYVELTREKKGAYLCDDCQRRLE